MHRERPLVDGRQFNTRRELKQYVSRMLMDLGLFPTRIEPDHKDFPFLLELVRRHPSADDWWINEIRAFNVDRHTTGHGGAKLDTVFSDGSIKAISWNRCITRIPWKPAAALSSAMRVAVTPQILQCMEGITFPFPCHNCRKEIADNDGMVLHHDPPFARLRDEFLSQRNDTPSTFANNGDHRGPVFRVSDSMFSEAWELFHNANAFLYPVCSACHIPSLHGGDR